MVSEAGNPENLVVGPTPVNYGRRKSMNRKKAIRLLLEAVREVRGYALAEKEGLVLAPSKTNPAVRRWQRAEDGKKGGGLKGALKKGAKVGLGVAGALALLRLAGKAGAKAVPAEAMKAIEGLPEEEREKLSKDPRFQKAFEFYEAVKKDAKNRGFASGDEAGERLLRAMKRYRGYALGEAEEKR